MDWRVGEMVGKGVCWWKCGWSCVGARVDVKRGIASVGCVLGVCRFWDGGSVLWKVGVGGSGVFAERWADLH